MECLHREGWRGVTLGDSVGADNEVVIAFDDGYQCVADHAFETLDRLGFKASVFLPTGYLGKTNDWDHQVYGLKFRHLDQTGLRKLSDAGWEIGSHGTTHRSLRDMDSAKATKEIVDSKALLENIIGTTVDSISFPFGLYNRRILEISASAGYRRGLTPSIQPGVAVPKEFRLVEGDPVYIWDRFANLSSRFSANGTINQIGRSIRRLAHFGSRGTVIYQRIASSVTKNLP